MSKLADYLSQFDAQTHKTRTTYFQNGVLLFCIQSRPTLVVGVTHRKEFADFAGRCGASNIGTCNEMFNGWVTFENRDDAIPFLEYVAEAKISDAKMRASRKKNR